jgi:hypothetical protein
MSGPAVSARPARSHKAAADILSERDPVLRRLVAQAGPVRVNPPTETHFAALVRAILYQQLAGAAARAIHGRVSFHGVHVESSGIAVDGRDPYVAADVLPYRTGQAAAARG